ncbi:TetR/AcrR family transcriptional regulator [Frondihabitans cladoniiphilus]|uniref:TetR/AcrR family transcriptional regulator n=1 Tax=Frondihabitans cladoniiphilus TaxID=715785 RepID=A0ABP8WBW4_9MICO
MPTKSLSTSERRIPAIVDAARDTFAVGGYAGTTVADVAKAAGISSAYVFKLFPTKQDLFVAALDRSFVEIVETLTRAADASSATKPDDVLDAMAAAYAGLIADRTLLLLQVHAQSSAGVTEVGAALRRGLEKVTTTASQKSKADDDAVQRFLAFGQLCHLVVTAGIGDVDADWARLIARGIRHPDTATP